jgi:hypothetical protein
LQSTPEGPQAHVEIDKGSGRIIVSVDGILVLEAQTLQGTTATINVSTQWIASEHKLGINVQVTPGTVYEILTEGLKQLGSTYPNLSFSVSSPAQKLPQPVTIREGELSGAPVEGQGLQIDTGPGELPRELARPTIESLAVRPIKRSSLSPEVHDYLANASTAFVPTMGFLQSVGYEPATGLLAQEALASEAALAESALAGGALTEGAFTAEATVAVIESAGIAESLAGAAATLTAIEAGGGAELEAATGPVGWIVGGVILLTIGGLTLGAWILSDSPSSTAPGEGSATTPTVTPIPVTISMPTTATAARRNPGQTCEESVLDALQAAKDQICNSIPGESCSPAKVSPKRLARRPCSAIRQRIQSIRDCLAIRQKIQDECFGGLPDEIHEEVLKQINSGLAACLALEAVNCAPGHPMSRL